jgi:hypothetical protein
LFPFASSFSTAHALSQCQKHALFARSSFCSGGDLSYIVRYRKRVELQPTLGPFQSTFDLLIGVSASTRRPIRPQTAKNHDIARSFLHGSGSLGRSGKEAGIDLRARVPAKLLVLAEGTVFFVLLECLSNAGFLLDFFFQAFVPRATFVPRTNVLTELAACRTNAKKEKIKRNRENMRKFKTVGKKGISRRKLMKKALSSTARQEEAEFIAKCYITVPPPVTPESSDRKYNK